MLNKLGGKGRRLRIARGSYLPPVNLLQKGRSGHANMVHFYE